METSASSYYENSCSLLAFVINHAPSQDVDTSLVKLLAEERSSSLIPYIENHDLYIAFEETKAILDKYKVCVCVCVCVCVWVCVCVLVPISK